MAIMLKFYILLIILVTPILGAAFEGRVVGGEDADLGDVPSIISLRGNGGNHKCGGVLISKYYAITAAHCSASSGDSIQYGVLNIDPNASDKTVISVAKVFTHENFTFYTLENDIALLKLAKPAKFGKNVKPAVLPNQDELTPPGSDVLLAGWGLNATNGIASERLQKANLTIVDIEECKNIHDFTVFDSNLCAGVPGGSKEQCSGDSGGPLIFNGTVVGLVSWSIKPCGIPPYPGVYTRVASFREWIRKTSGV